MGVWIIEPHDPLIFRDGRPFGPTPGARATSLPFPFPSTTAGAVRTQAGLDANGIFRFVGQNDVLTKLKQLNVRGPLLVQLPADGFDSITWLVPPPLDAVLFPTKDEQQNDKPDTFRIRRLIPRPFAGGFTDLVSPNEPFIDNLELVGFASPESIKPASGAPLYWNWNFFSQWLLGQPDNQEIAREKIGHNGLQREIRVHIAMDSQRGNALYGALFDTSGMEFTSSSKHPKQISQAQRLALAVIVDDHDVFQLHEGLGSFGGERRLVSWYKSSQPEPPCPEGLIDRIIRDKQCRLILLTPACFAKGYYPTAFFQPSAPITITLKAISTQTPEIVSGWDMVKRKPKPTRRLAPSGTVLYLSLKGDDDDIATWVQNTWLHSISDDPQDRADGFGLAVLGTWSSKNPTIID